MSITIAAIGPAAAVAALTPVATTLVPAIKLDALTALDAGTTTRSLLSTSNVADASASVIDFSTLAQLLAATVVFQTYEAQQAKAIASGTATSSDFSKLVATASFFVEAFNRFQTSVGAMTNSFESSFDTSFLLALHTQNVQVGSEHAQSFIDSLAQVGIHFNEATEETNPNQFKIDSQALEAAFNANPAQTTNLLDKALKGLVVIEAKLLASEPKLDMFTSDFTPALSVAVPASQFDLNMVNANLSKLSTADAQEINNALQRLLADESLGAAIDATPITSSATSTQADAVELLGKTSNNASASADSGVDSSAGNSVADTLDNKLGTTSSSTAASVEKLLTEIPTSVSDAVLAPVVVVPDSFAPRATQPAAVSNSDESPTLPYSSIEVGLNSANSVQSPAKISTVENAVTQTGQGDDLDNTQVNTALNTKVQSNTNVESNNNTNTKPSTSTKIQTRQTRIGSSVVDSTAQLDSNAQAATIRQGANAASAQADRAMPVVEASRTIATQTDLNNDDKLDAPRRNSIESNTKSAGATRALIAESASSQLKPPAAASIVRAMSSNDDVERVADASGVDKKSRTSNAAQPQIQPILQPANLINSEPSGTKEAPTVQGEPDLTNKDAVNNKASIVEKPITFSVDDVSSRTTSTFTSNGLRSSTSTSQTIPASAQAAFEYPTVQPQATPVHSSINPSIAAAVAAYRFGETVIVQESDELASVATEIVPDVSVIPRIDVLELDPHDGNSDDARIAAALNEVKTSAQRAEFKVAHGQSPPLDSVDVLA
ncbi:hypothetical protein H8K52_01460 [Undibacterium seohonense]|uniref:Uncharacterized protein n=1 Tax=Undibacterium seohonense TaxID=1344950 RepID=A0ABR6X0X3_9BURK|nr:hypothetical protein [Undibacterium seohonense]MBC3806009.1 hypothetical protein [Undibacterium seohonense]